MTKFAVIAAGGRLGGKLVTEALNREIQVTGFINHTPCRDARAVSVQKSLFDLTAEDLAEFDAVLSAYGSGFQADPAINFQAVAHLAQVLQGTGTHLLTIGGAGCLYADPEKKTHVCEAPGHPDFLRDISRNLLRGLDYLRTVEGLDWTFVCPSLILDAEGPRTDDYLTGTEQMVLTNEDGYSYVSYDDLASAMVDCACDGSCKGQVLTVASRHGAPKA